MFEEDEVRVLTDLGLTSRQAKVFLVLTKCDSSGARALAVASKIPRQDIYKVLEELLRLGLIEKQIGTPTRFVAMPIEETLKFLFKRRIEKTSDIKLRMKTIAMNRRGLALANGGSDEPRMFLIPEKEAFVLKIKKSLNSTHRSIDAVAPQKNLDQALYHLVEALKKAVQRGVKMRFIVEQSLGIVPRSIFPIALRDNPHFEIRTMPNQLGLRFCLYDNKELSVSLSSNHDFAKSTLLWTDCESLVEAYRNHFEMLWLTAAKFSWWESDIQPKAQ